MRVAGHALHGDALETGALEQAGQLALGEALLAVLELLAHPLLVVGQEVDHEQAPSRREDAHGLGQGVARLFGVVQGLAHEHHVVLIARQGQVVDVALDRLDVVEAGGRGTLLELGQHGGREVDRGHALGRLGQHQGHLAVADAQVRVARAGQELDQGAAQALPGAAGQLGLAEALGHAVEVGARLALAALEQRLEPRQIGHELRRLGAAGEHVLHQRRVALEAVVAAPTRAAIDHQADLLEQVQVGRDAALAHVEDLHQVRAVELLAGQEVQDPQAGFVPQGLQQAGRVGQFHHAIGIA